MNIEPFNSKQLVKQHGEVAGKQRLWNMQTQREQLSETCNESSASKPSTSTEVRTSCLLAVQNEYCRELPGSVCDSHSLLMRKTNTISTELAVPLRTAIAQVCNELLAGDMSALCVSSSS